MPPASNPALPPPRFRAKAAEDEARLPVQARTGAKAADPAASLDHRPTCLTMPSPEQLGVAQPSSRAGIDWTATHQRLDRLGAVSFHLEKLAQGGCRVSCLLPTLQPDRSHRIEARASSEAEAVLLALDKAEEWTAVVRAAHR